MFCGAIQVRKVRCHCTDSVYGDACCVCADERLRGTKVCDREGNLKPDTHFIFSALPDSSLAAEGQPALKLAPPHRLPLMPQAALVSAKALKGCKACARHSGHRWAWSANLADCAQSLLEAHLRPG